jgi:hypothetical protein
VGNRWTWTISGCCVATLGALGCGPSAVDDGDGSGTATGGSTTSAASTGASASSTGGADASTGAAATTSTDADTTTGAATSEGTETGEPACPPPERILADFSVTPDADVSAICTVTSLGGEPGASVVELDCNGQAVTLTVSASPPIAEPNVTMGQQVQLDYVTDPIFWINRWVALRTTGGRSDWLLVGGVSGSALDPPGTTIDAFFGGASTAPIVAEAPGLCEPLEDDCGPVERLALDFGLFDGAQVRVFDHGAELFDVLAYGYWFVVESAIRHPRPQGCDDVPREWWEFVMVWFPSD